MEPATKSEVETKQSETEKPERDLAVWTAPARPFKRRNKQFYTTIIAIAGIVGLVFFLVEGAMPVITLISVIFLFYVMSTIEPEAVQYKVTTKGIKIGDRLTEWAVTRRFWFSKRFDSDLLVIETLYLPGRLELVVHPEDIMQIKKSIAGFITEEEAPPTSVDRLTNWFSKKLPS